jgi:predicted TIM-barrel fold metal-dependent hydrolase
VPLIAIEEHYISSKVRESQKVDRYATFPPHLIAKLQSLSDERIQDINNTNMSLQVIPHGPRIRSLSLYTESKDKLTSAISKKSHRIARFAMLPIGDPVATAIELKRRICDLQFLGALIDSHVDRQTYDDERLWTVFKKVQELDVPLYIHPSFAADNAHYRGNYNDSIALALGAFG